MNRCLGLLVPIFALTAAAQSTTNTTCNTSGTITNCTSNTTDRAAQNQRAYEAGQQFGNALGSGLAAAMEAHSFNKGLSKYCLAHPGEEWKYRSRQTGEVLSSGRCPTDEQRAEGAALDFMSKHKDFVRCSENSNQMVQYISAHNLNPLEEKSFERAYKDLKKGDQLKLYAR